MQVLLLCMAFMGVGFVTGIAFICKYIDWQQGKNKNYIEKMNRTMNLLNQWIILKEEGIGCYSVLEQKNIKRIAVYGMGICGRHLVRELCKTDLEILYAMDRKKMSSFLGVRVFRPEEELPQVDIIINTVITEHQTIAEMLKKHFKCPVINLEDIIFECYPVGR